MTRRVSNASIVGQSARARTAASRIPGSLLRDSAATSDRAVRPPRRPMTRRRLSRRGVVALLYASRMLPVRFSGSGIRAQSVTRLFRAAARPASFSSANRSAISRPASFSLPRAPSAFRAAMRTGASRLCAKENSGSAGAPVDLPRYSMSITRAGAVTREREARTGEIARLEGIRSRAPLTAAMSPGSGFRSRIERIAGRDPSFLRRSAASTAAARTLASVSPRSEATARYALVSPRPPSMERISVRGPPFPITATHLAVADVPVMRDARRRAALRIAPLESSITPVRSSIALSPFERTIRSRADARI